MGIVAKNRFLIFAATLMIAIANGAQAADYCPGLAKTVGPNPPAAVTGSLQGTRCGNWHAETPRGTWDLPFLLSVNGHNVTYVTYWTGQPIKVIPDTKWDGQSSVTFDIPLSTLTQGNSQGTVHYAFKLRPNGDIEPTSDSVPDGGDRVLFVSVPKLAPFPSAQAAQTGK